FQAEDGIRDRNVTGVQTCALPIYQREHPGPHDPGLVPDVALWLLLLTHASYLTTQLNVPEEVRWLANVASLFAFGRRSRISSAKIGRAACRERLLNIDTICRRTIT